MKVSLDELKNAARDARLELSSRELDELQAETEKLLILAEPLKNTVSEEVEAEFYGLRQQNTPREDRVQPSLPVEKALANAPDTDDACFRVPKIIE